MDSVKYELKIFFQDPGEVEPAALIPTLHQWIQTQRLEELLIDVADYRHVHHGPAVLLIAHDAHYVIDMDMGRPGLLYSRRRETHPSRPEPVSVPARLASVFQCAFTACQALETEPGFAGRLRFRTDQLLFRINDRLLAPNTLDQFDDFRHELEPFIASLYDTPVELTQRPEEDSRLTIHIQTTEAPDMDTLLSPADMGAAETPVRSGESGFRAAQGALLVHPHAQWAF